MISARPFHAPISIIIDIECLIAQHPMQPAVLLHYAVERSEAACLFFLHMDAYYAEKST